MINNLTYREKTLWLNLLTTLALALAELVKSATQLIYYRKGV
jgi:hypothetical protein